jgi:hypothetical protein
MSDESATKATRTLDKIMTGYCSGEDYERTVCDYLSEAFNAGVEAAAKVAEEADCMYVNGRPVIRNISRTIARAVLSRTPAPEVKP